jgi:hypothetical protein
VRVVILTFLLAWAMGGCSVMSSSGRPPGGSTRAAPVVGHDRDTRTALLQIETQLNADYAANRVGAVYDRWDAPSRAVISRRQYVRRHVECPTPPGPAVTENAEPAPGGWWRVHYSIGGTQLVDVWRYVDGRWRFDLLRSDPHAVALYRLPFASYARATGCTPT